MVYREGADETRHATGRSGSGRAGTDAVVESHRIACSHFDAYRFFTSSGAAAQRAQPGREDRPAYEQPACLHAGMDLYKHAFRLSPMVPSDLVADCFELAWDIRVMDMRAAPYDLVGARLRPRADRDGRRARRTYVAAAAGVRRARRSPAAAADRGVRAARSGVTS